MIIQADRIIIRPDRIPLVAGAFVVKYGRIHAVGKATSIIRNFPGHRIVSLEKAIVVPGLVNVHTHLELPPLLNDIRASNYTDWVLNLLKVKKLLTRHDYIIAAHRNIAALVRSGTTTVAEICSHNASPAVISQSRLRAVIYQEIISMEQTPHRGILPRRAGSSPLIRFGLSPHSPHTVSEAVLNVVRSYADQKRLGICMHVAETQDELRLFQRKKSGLERLYAAAGWDVAMAPKARSSFELLRRVGILSPAFLAVHAVHVDDQDLAIIKTSGAGIAHCPRSNREIGIGTMHLKKFLEARIPVGLGTDSLASSPSLNLWDEMRYAYYVHRRSGITPQDIFQMATTGGARALGMDKEIGSLEPGKKADIIAVPLPQKDSGDLYSDLLRETNTCIMSMVNGHVIYRSEANVKI
jgi:aminodeoxyfutalosine deaminase